MKVLITGGNGFIGQKLARQLLNNGIQVSQGDQSRVDELILCDVQPAPFPINDPRVSTQLIDISESAAVETLVGSDIDVIYHLAAVVSGQAEQQFELGMKINFDGTRNLLEACRKLDTTPTFIFSSSAAVYGGEMPDVLDDNTIPNPQTSYGAQKLMGEVMVNDYSRKGFIDGRSVRLPTVSVRPGKANAAASSFASSIIREPLNGVAIECPVRDDTVVWITSPRTVVNNIVHAANVTANQMGMSRAIKLPGLTVTVGDMLGSLERIAGANVRGLVASVPDPVIEKIVYSWPGRFTTERANAMGFQGDSDFDEIVKNYISDDLEG